MKYPTPSGGSQQWKMGYVTESAYNSSIGGTTPTPPVATSWQYPMDNAYCTWSTPGSNMSWGMYSYTGTGRNYHVGIDIAGRTSSNVYAAAAGKIVAASENGSNGRYIVIEHTIGTKLVYSFYAHLSSQTLTSGQVSKGQKIGVMGSTGNAKGAHLHFAIASAFQKGDYVGYVAPVVSGNTASYGNTVFYNPVYVIKNGKLP